MLEMESATLITSILLGINSVFFILAFLWFGKFKYANRNGFLVFGVMYGILSYQILQNAAGYSILLAILLPVVGLVSLMSQKAELPNSKFLYISLLILQFLLLIINLYLGVSYWT